MRAVACSERYGLPRPISVQNVLNLLQQEEYRSMEEICRQEEIGYIGYSPLAMGMLSGKYSGKALPRGSRFDLFERYRREYLTEDYTARVETLEAIARERRMTLAELALSWALTRRAVACVLTSVSSVQQLRDVARVAEIAAGQPDGSLELGR
jgi:aryl-alcohol dehydrogenase-like predicted oxidoreductase